MFEYACHEGNQSLPNTMSSIRSLGTPLRAMTASAAATARSVAVRSASDPPKLPNGVRAYLTKDADRADATSGVRNLDVHYSSGPGNHVFYLMSEGSGDRCAS